MVAGTPAGLRRHTAMDGADSANVEVLRRELLVLHKSLLDAQRVEYERARGRIETPGEFLGLVLHHEAFEWIRSLSALIAGLDEWAEDRERAGPAALDALLASLRELIRPGGADRDFGARYWKLVEEAPEVTVAHVKVWRLLD